MLSPKHGSEMSTVSDCIQSGLLTGAFRVLASFLAKPVTQTLHKGYVMTMPQIHRLRKLGATWKLKGEGASTELAFRPFEHKTSPKSGSNPQSIDLGEAGFCHQQRSHPCYRPFIIVSQWRSYIILEPLSSQPAGSNASTKYCCASARLTHSEHQHHSAARSGFSCQLYLMDFLTALLQRLQLGLRLSHFLKQISHYKAYTLIISKLCLHFSHQT